jgi:DNA-binding NarL/FixJ family response regulator
MRLEIEPGLVVAGEAGLDEVAARAEVLAPDVVVVDADAIDRPETVTPVVSRMAGAHAVVVLSLDERAATERALLAAGATAFVQKHDGSTALISAIRAAAEPGREGGAMH